MSSTLTKKEREGLEDIFLSIKDSNKISAKFSTLLTLYKSIKGHYIQQKSVKSMKNGKIKDKIKENFTFFSKLKKNLSK